MNVLPAAVLAAALTLSASAPSRAQEPAPAVSPAILELAEQAALGDEIALYNLGVEYFRGVEVPQDYTRSAAFWRRSVELGNSRAMNNLGYLLFHGLGVEPEPEKAVALWRRAVADGEVEPHLHLAWASEHGEGTELDLVEAYARYLAVRRLAEPSQDESDRALLDGLPETLAKLEATLSTAQKREAETRAESYVRAPARPSPSGGGEP